MKMTIKRVSMSGEAVFGVLLDNYGIPFALTAERPWLDNNSNISCIPNGTYTCRRVQSPRFGNTFEVCDVPNRTHILFHKGNIPGKDSHGCILVGEQFGILNGNRAVLASNAGFHEFLQLLADEVEFTLHIMEV